MDKKLDKNMIEGEMIMRAVGGKGEQGFIASICFDDERMLGYFFDWWEEVGKEQFEAAIIDL